MASKPAGGEPVLPWDQFKPAKTRQALSRDAIVDAAAAIVDEQGLSALSMRAVAQALGTGAASLYAHVTSKEQLLDLLLDRVYGEFETPEPEPGRWQEQLKDFVRGALRIVRSHPGMAAAMLSTPPMGPNGLRLTEGMLSLMRGAGMPDAVSAYVGELIGQYIAVTALEQETFSQRFGVTDKDAMAEWIGQFRSFLSNLPAGQYPNLVEMARNGAMTESETEDDRFELGLDIIVRGLASYGRVGHLFGYPGVSVVCR